MVELYLISGALALWMLFVALHSTPLEGEQEAASFRVLVIENESINQVFVYQACENLNIDCLIVTDDLEALEALEQWPFGLVLLDLDMQGCDVFELSEQIRGTGVAVPIVGLTQHMERSFHERCLKAGIGEVLPKPIDLELLEFAIQRRLKAVA